MAAGYRQDRTG